MNCSTCHKEAPIQRICLGTHRFCSSRCVVEYADTNKNVSWKNGETYKMYYEIDFDSRIKETLGGQHESNGSADTGHQAVPQAIPAPVEITPAPDTEQVVARSEGREGVLRAEVCLCRSGVLDVYKKRGLDYEQESRQNCADKKCACFNALSTRKDDVKRD